MGAHVTTGADEGYVGNSGAGSCAVDEPPERGDGERVLVLDALSRADAHEVLTWLQPHLAALFGEIDRILSTLDGEAPGTPDGDG